MHSDRPVVQRRGRLVGFINNAVRSHALDAAPRSTEAAHQGNGSGKGEGVKLDDLIAAYINKIDGLGPQMSRGQMYVVLNDFAREVLARYYTDRYVLIGPAGQKAERPTEAS